MELIPCPCVMKMYFESEEQQRIIRIALVNGGWACQLSQQNGLSETQTTKNESFGAWLVGDIYIQYIIVSVP